MAPCADNEMNDGQVDATTILCSNRCFQDGDKKERSYLFKDDLILADLILCPRVAFLLIEENCLEHMFLDR